MTKLLLTGATSFVGGRFLEHVLEHTDWTVYSLERLPVRGSCSSRVHSYYHDLRSEIPERIVSQVIDADYLVHCAAEVSGIKSLADPRLTVTTNVNGTYNVLELARKMVLSKFIYVSSGEALGAVKIPDELDENASLRPSNPYAASKAAGEVLANAYRVSFNVPTIIVRSMNLFGEGQRPPRFVPMVVKSLLEDRIITCHVNKIGVQGSRNWLHVEKFIGGLTRLLDHGKVGEIYHVVGPQRENIDIIRLLANALNKSLHVQTKVPGPSHDFRYALKDSKLNYHFESDFEKTIDKTAQWYAANPGFLS